MAKQPNRVPVSAEKLKALQVAMDKIDKSYGKGSIMKLGDDKVEDWLERDGETFVHIRKKGRLGWEKTLEAEDSYSSYLSDSLTQEELIKNS